MHSIATQICNLPVAGCYLTMVGKNIPAQSSRDNSSGRRKLTLQALFNSNSNANGHTDHGGAMGAPPVAE